jgi:uncharacterized protein YcfJ
MEDDMKKFALMAAASAFLLASGVTAAMADECSGHDHDTGTAVGAVGGGLIGGLATHSVVGGLAGAVVGGVAGNAIARDNDCSHQAYEDRKQSQAYDKGYADRAEQDSAPPPPAYRDDYPN